MTEHDLSEVRGPFALLVAPESALAAARHLASQTLSRQVHNFSAGTEKAQDPELARFDAALDREDS